MRPIRLILGCWYLLASVLAAILQDVRGEEELLRKAEEAMQ